MTLDNRDPLLKAADHARIASLLSSKDDEIERLRAVLKWIEVEDHDEDAEPGRYSEAAHKALANLED